MYIVLAVIIILVIVGIIVYYSTSDSSTTSQNKQDVKSVTKTWDQKVSDSTTKTNTNQTGMMVNQSRQTGKLNVIEGP
ncbi:MAG: hypothetical protein EBU90_13795 [Proteobacteria bacterium]|nr:hypothetical protein [Pseudomonadota bacterium]NBP13576.1 hypothetical protein [bacterium]